MAADIKSCAETQQTFDAAHVVWAVEPLAQEMPATKGDRELGRRDFVHEIAGHIQHCISC